MLFSCTDEDYANLNTDPINPYDVSGEALFNRATVSLFNQMESTNQNRNIFRLLAQYWTETTYVDEANYDLNRRNIPGNHWNVLYTSVLFNLKDAKEHVKKNSELSESQKNGRIAQITIMEVYAWQILVDTFGDIPYTEALNVSNNPTPAYDDSKKIYDDLFNRLDDVLSNLDGSQGFSDVNYGGNMMNWKKLGNSLKLKLATRIADAYPVLAKTKAEEAILAGVFSSNSDNFIIKYEGANPNTNPIWNDLVESGRSDYVIANTVADYMNELNDPRRTEFFDDNLENGYVGAPYGSPSSFSNYTHIGKKMHQPTFRGVLFDYAEVSFYLAEAAARGWNAGGSPESHYKSAIIANMEDWEISEDKANQYLSQSSVDYQTAEGDWKQKIGFQFWIAMYNRGFEGWSVWRKFNTPKLNLPGDTERPVPLRYTYPQREQTSNKSNYEAASIAIGGDKQSTAIFWDIN